MTDLITKDSIKIEDLIYEVRGKQVMLDKDVALLYNVETRRVNEVIKRNINRFPDSFCFKLTKEELEGLSSRSQIAILNKNGNMRGYNIKYLPYALTEQGVMMLSGLLRSDIAVKVNIKIIEAFVAMRKYIASNNYENRISNIETKLIDYDNKFDLVFDKLDNTVNNHIFFEGQIYDAYSLMMDILKEAKEEIIIIDNYAGKKLFDLLRDIKINIKVYSKNFDLELVKKYNSQYSNISTFIHNGFHDRFIILDKSILYHCGSSFKDLGIKCFAINRVESSEILNNLLDKINGDLLWMIWL